MKFKYQLMFLATSLAIVGCKNGSESGLVVENLSSEQPASDEVVDDVAGEGVSEPVETIKKLSIDINKFPMTKTVCDPFTNESSTKITHGLKTQLVYKLAGQPSKTNVNDVFANYAPSEKTLFFSTINAPTRAFSSGFLTEAGETLKTDSGEKLVEHFGLHYTSFLSLAETDEEGLYDLSILSDDGSIVKIGRGSQQETLISNDGDHPTRMGCANRFVEMKRGQKIAIDIKWYQGPRHHIANVLLWRKVSANDAKDASCGATGNDLFFDSNNNSVPKTAYNNLISSGWKVVAKENFVLDEQVQDYNPCVVGTAPVISNFTMNEAILNAAWFSWKTDIPSTSQVLITDKSTGEVAITNSDNVLRTQHEIKILNLKPMTSYKAQVVSISETLGRSMGPVVEFTTP